MILKLFLSFVSSESVFCIIFISNTDYGLFIFTAHFASMHVKQRCLVLVLQADSPSSACALVIFVRLDSACVIALRHEIFDLQHTHMKSKNSTLINISTTADGL